MGQAEICRPVESVHAQARSTAILARISLPVRFIRRGVDPTTARTVGSIAASIGEISVPGLYRKSRSVSFAVRSHLLTLTTRNHGVKVEVTQGTTSEGLVIAATQGEPLLIETTPDDSELLPDGSELDPQGPTP